MRVSKDDPPQMFGAGRMWSSNRGVVERGFHGAGFSVTWGKQGPYNNSSRGTDPWGEPGYPNHPKRHYNPGGAYLAPL